MKHGGKETSAPGETLLNGSSALDVRLARVPPLTLVMEVCLAALLTFAVWAVLSRRWWACGLFSVLAGNA